jgi:hypothetical protein
MREAQVQHYGFRVCAAVKIAVGELASVGPSLIRSAQLNLLHTHAAQLNLHI